MLYYPARPIISTRQQRRMIEREKIMNMQQAICLGQKAKAAGYSVRVENGKVQFVTVIYADSGESTVTQHTDWIDYEEAMEIIAQ